MNVSFSVLLSEQTIYRQSHFFIDNIINTVYLMNFLCLAQNSNEDEFLKKKKSKKQTNKQRPRTSELPNDLETSSSNKR